MLFKGQCHCGAIRVELTTERQPGDQVLGACQCSFCRKHNARAFSDPKARVTLTVGDPQHLQRYSFGLRTSDQIICRRCGVYVAMTLTDGDRVWSVVNVDTLDARALFTRTPEPRDYSAEDRERRIARRKARWCPTTLVGGPRRLPDRPAACLVTPAFFPPQGAFHQGPAGRASGPASFRAAARPALEAVRPAGAPAGGAGAVLRPAGGRPAFDVGSGEACVLHLRLLRGPAFLLNLWPRFSRPALLFGPRRLAGRRPPLIDFRRLRLICPRLSLCWSPGRIGLLAGLRRFLLTPVGCAILDAGSLLGFAATGVRDPRDTPRPGILRREALRPPRAHRDFAWRITPDPCWRSAPAGVARASLQRGALWRWPPAATWALRSCRRCHR